MASFISDSIFVGLKTQFEDAMRTLVQRIAEGEGLDEAELMTKYLVNVVPMTKEAKGKAPAKRQAKVTITETGSATKCCCTTAKGKPCALKALDGSTMCRVHAKKADEPGPAPKPKKTKEPKPKKTKKTKTEAPVHTHELDEEQHDDCELCQTHGNPLNETQEDEYETVMSPRRTLRERLLRVAEEEEFVEDEDEA